MRDDTPLARYITRHWYDEDGERAALLRPLSALFGGVASVRRAAFRQGLMGRERLPVPVIVVGNIAVGGTGKTPLVVALVEWLRDNGWRPGVISRGYGGAATEYPRRVERDALVDDVGDEPLLIARRCGVPVAVDPDRPRAGQFLVESGEVDVLVADDGLQHYALARDVEIAVVDAKRGLGNGALLPAGPLREPPRRLKRVDFVICNGGACPAVQVENWTMQLQPLPPVTLTGLLSTWDDWQGRAVHAIAGIGHPQRFFDALIAKGMDITPHAFPDHYRYTPEDLDFGDDKPVLMTEKDAVKCHAFANQRHWCVPIHAVLSDGFFEQLAARLPAPAGRADNANPNES